VTARQPAPHGHHHAPAGLAEAADRWLRRFLAGVLGAMTLVTCAVGALAFYTSFEAIRAYAEHSGGISPAHAWAVPLLVDSFLVVATGADLWLSTRPTRSLVEMAAPKALLAGAALVSFVLNIAHAEQAGWAARGVAAIPPAALVLSVELVLMIVRRAVGARAVRLAAPAPADRLAEPAADHAGSDTQPARPAPPTRRLPSARRQANHSDGPRRRALAMLRQDPGISGGRLGRAVGMSERWGRSVRPALVAELAATSGTSTNARGGNGDGDHAAAAPAGVLALPAPAAGDGSDAPA
jgi:hypothetical protein